MADAYRDTAPVLLVGILGEEDCWSGRQPRRSMDEDGEAPSGKDRRSPIRAGIAKLSLLPDESSRIEEGREREVLLVDAVVVPTKQAAVLLVVEEEDDKLYKDAAARTTPERRRTTGVHR